MALARSKANSQGRVSVPAEIRRRLGVKPGSTLEWVEDGGKIVLQRTEGYTFEDIRKALFPNGPPPMKTLEEIREGVERAKLEHYTRR